MKKTFFLCVLFIAVGNIYFGYAKIWRVNNNPGVAADFTTLQAAHNGAASGDTVHLEGSPNSYGSLTCTKKLFIVGPGYFLGENPGTQALQQSAQVGPFTLNVGSAGTVITGLDFRLNGINVYSNDIFIRRNYFGSQANGLFDYQTGQINLLYLSNSGGNVAVSNIIITQNFGVKISATFSAMTSLIITNNYLAADGYIGDGNMNPCLTLHSNTVALIQNNIFRRGTVQVNNSSLFNNIMYSGSFSGTGNLVSNNIANGTQFGTDNGNKNNEIMSSVFMLTGSPDNQWKLKAGSPAIGGGFGSTAQDPIDCGVFGGNTPYVLAGQPSMPAIYYFSNQPIGSNIDPINVTIKVKSAGN
jgi:hypothetical protein